MKRKLLLITILLVGGLFVSCSSDESGEKKTETPVKAAPLPITITSTSSEFLINGENLEINGSNFVNKDYPTKIFLNGIEITAKEITTNKITLSSPNVAYGVNTLRIQIQNVESTPLSFFAIAKGWNTLNVLGTAEITSSSVFDDSKTIFSLIDSGSPKKLEAKATGYTQTSLNIGNFFGDFKMFDEKTGVITATYRVLHTDNAFETINETVADNAFTKEINGLNIGYQNGKSSILYTIVGSQIYTGDNGKTVIKNPPPVWCTGVNGKQIRLNVGAFGKSTSDDKFYQLGIINDSKKYGNNKYKNVVMQSATGYSDWIVKDTISDIVLNQSFYYKFQNINRILSIGTNKTLVESTDMLKTWNVIKTDVSAVFLRTETQWYIQSGDKLFVTKDSGKNWEFELELPTGSKVNDISFSKNKIIVSGSKGLHYLKIE
ncbi:hypothetical protein RB619_05870 [Flavobacterium sp. LHD-80]|uniref:IPT/TIG domain-containing protein n=1 Tax=Flavobacterium sp. LHD-80 TaxID=3071411 RepID=UPI0027DF14DF|nr:IPT/TIG domain-containing protein [Flavobacterium sp. LHD-80]MDQ6470163.1 hypothetical protein [Flavobacterium sp. LHD-80]